MYADARELSLLSSLTLHAEFWHRRVSLSRVGPDVSYRKYITRLVVGGHVRFGRSDAVFAQHVQ